MRFAGLMRAALDNAARGVSVEYQSCGSCDVTLVRFFSRLGFAIELAEDWH